MTLERYEHYRPKRDVHNLIHYAIHLAMFMAIAILAIYVMDLQRMDRAHAKAYKVLNERFDVEYHYDPPPGWMRR